MAYSTSNDWSLSDTQQGQIVEGMADLDQCLRILLGTQKFTDPLRPEFGIDLLAYVDKPINQAAPFLRKEILDSVALFEKRITIKSITYELVESNALFTITWSSSYGATTTTIPF